MVIKWLAAPLVILNAIELDPVPPIWFPVKLDKEFAALKNSAAALVLEPTKLPVKLSVPNAPVK